MCNKLYEYIDKPMLTTEEQIIHLKEKNVSFNLYSEHDAYEYLQYNNNYFKLASYRKNYDKYHEGVNTGKYIALDFGYLRDLAIIDMRLRYVLIQMSLDIEHYAKMQILRSAEQHHEDGYQICEDFILSLVKQQQDSLNQELSRNISSIYCHDLYEKYHNHFPVWAFLEIISFGRLISFYGFCSTRYNDKHMRSQYFMLKECKGVRNAAAHSSCILNDLHLGTANRKSHPLIMLSLSNVPDLPKASRIKRMSCARIQQLVTLLYMHNDIVTSDGVHEKAASLLNDFVQRMMRHYDYYESNILIKTTFDFLNKIIDNWYLKV